MKRPLIVNGIDLEEEGVKVIKLPPIQLSTKKVEKKEVDGRDGNLTEENSYINDTKNVEADYIGTDPLKLLAILNSAKEVIFGNIPDRYYKCRLDNQIPMEQVIENQLYNFLISFDCQPFGYLLEGKEPLLLTGPTTLFNDKATYYSLPDITIYGSGSCTFTINGRTFNITEIGGSITINSYLKEVLNNKGQYMKGYFPYLDYRDENKGLSGENNISWTGSITSVELTPHWRCR